MACLSHHAHWLITRTRDAQDERRVLIDLTEAGEALREVVVAIPEKIEMAACRLSKLSPEDIAEFWDAVNGLGRARMPQEPDLPTS
jgi:DNA-binding MarR family transcriptional regulator